MKPESKAPVDENEAPKKQNNNKKDTSKAPKIGEMGPKQEEPKEKKGFLKKLFNKNKEE